MNQTRIDRGAGEVEVGQILCQRQFGDGELVADRAGLFLGNLGLQQVTDDEQLTQNGIEALRTGIIERAAFRDLFDFGGTLSDLDPSQVRNLVKAIENAREFAGEVITRLRATEGVQ